MSSSLIFLLFTLTAATTSPLAARSGFPQVTPASVTPTVSVPPLSTSCSPTVPVPSCTTNCTPPVVVPPCTKNCTTHPVPNPPCTTNCTPPLVNLPCTTDCTPKVPVDLQSGCHPNFAGAALTLSTPSSTLSWSAKPIVGNPLSASSSPSKFLFQETGFPILSYIVKTQENNNFALQAKGGGPLIDNTGPSGSNTNQKWVVDCSWCSSTDISLTKGKVASGCRISSDATKQCVTSKTNPMTLQWLFDLFGLNIPNPLPRCLLSSSSGLGTVEPLFSDPSLQNSEEDEDLAFQEKIVAPPSRRKQTARAASSSGRQCPRKS
ncbi:hypothetical protein F5146DRAFT_1004376 [Armillaria mellea]|nr:hypothetical protein F5146DRAFT_1004376 [Armillaria mellea]